MDEFLSLYLFHLSPSSSLFLSLSPLRICSSSKRSGNGVNKCANCSRPKCRYYYYIHNGIDTRYVAGINPRWFKRIMSMVPKRLQKNQAEIRKAIDRNTIDYIPRNLKGESTYVGNRNCGPDYWALQEDP